MRWIVFILACWPSLLWADPLDQGEAYTMRQEPPVWMDKVDFSLLLVNYGVFALAVIGLGWLLFKKSEYLQRLESWVLSPFQMIFSIGRRMGGVTEVFLQIFAGLLAFICLAAWVFFCQWLKYKGLGAISMVGLAFAALMLVRLLKGKEKLDAT